MVIVYQWAHNSFVTGVLIKILGVSVLLVPFIETFSRRDIKYVAIHIDK